MLGFGGLSLANLLDLLFASRLHLGLLIGLDAIRFALVDAAKVRPHHRLELARTPFGGEAGARLLVFLGSLLALLALSPRRLGNFVGLAGREEGQTLRTIHVLLGKFLEV